MIRSLRVALAVLACAVTSACNCGPQVPAQLGEPCSATRGCDENLTCKDGVCVAVPGVGGGTGTGGGMGGGGDVDGGGGSGGGGGDVDGGAGGGFGGGAGGGGFGGGAGGGGFDGGAGGGSGAGGGGGAGGGSGAGGGGGGFGGGGGGLDGGAGGGSGAGGGGGGGGVGGGAGGGSACGPCSTPPASVCENSSTLRVYSLPGSCAGATCSYPSSSVTCAGSCANGACSGTGWAQQSSGTTQDLNAAWGSAANAVWAGGNYGTLLFWNGAVWQSRVSPTTSHVVSLGGTTAASVFALTSDGSFGSAWELLHFDGTSWSTVMTGVRASSSGVCVAGLAARQALVAVLEARSGPGGATYARVLYRVADTAGTWTRSTVGEFAELNGNAYDPCQVQVLGANDYVVTGAATKRWTGSAFSDFGGTATPTRGLFAASATAAVGVQGSSTVRVLSGTSWGSLNAGFNAQAVHGTSATRAFLVGGTGPYGGPYAPRAAMWDGLGVTAQTLPSGAAGYLNAVWAAPTGEVFAVGDQGLILRGP